MKKLLPLASVIGGCLLWELLAFLGWIDLRFFPRPTLVASRLFELTALPGFLGDLSISLVRVFAGAAVAFPFALLLALLGELSPGIGALLRPWIAFLYPLPKLAIFPLLLVIFGVGEAAKVALVAVGVFFLVLLNAGQGFRRVLSSEFYDVVRVYQVPLAKAVIRILLRGAAPEIVNGAKQGLGYGLVMVIAAEFTASQRGIGVFLWNSWDQFRVLDLYAGLLAVSLVGWLIFTLAGIAEKRLSRYE